MRVLLGADWHLSMLVGLCNTSACAEVSNIPGACLGSWMCLGNAGPETPSVTSEDGRAGETTAGTVLGPHS